MLGNFTFSLPGPGKLPVDFECSHLKTSISTFFPFSFWFPFPGYCEPALTGPIKTLEASPLGQGQPEGCWWVALCTGACVNPPSHWIGGPTSEFRLASAKSLTGTGERQLEIGLHC